MNNAVYGPINRRCAHSLLYTRRERGNREKIEMRRKINNRIYGEACEEIHEHTLHLSSTATEAV